MTKPGHTTCYADTVTRRRLKMVAAALNEGMVDVLRRLVRDEWTRCGFTDKHLCSEPPTADSAT